MIKPNDSSNAMVSVIQLKEKGILATTHMLARTWRIVLFKYGLSGAGWHRQLSKYQLRMQKELSPKAAANLKGNLNSRLSSDTLSWDGLITGLNILEFDKIEFNLVLSRKGKTRTIKLTSINEFNDVNEDENELHN